MKRLITAVRITGFTMMDCTKETRTAAAANKQVSPAMDSVSINPGQVPADIMSVPGSSFGGRKSAVGHLSVAF